MDRRKLKIHQVESLDELTSGDWHALDGYDACFNTLGTHIIAPKDLMRTVNLDYAVSSARLAKRMGVRYCGYLSGMGANPNRGIYLAKMKGRAENELKGLGFEHLTTFRIRSIRDRNNENDVRLMDKLLALIPFKNLSLETKDLAKILIHDSLTRLDKAEPGQHMSILSGGDMAAILKTS